MTGPAEILRAVLSASFVACLTPQVCHAQDVRIDGGKTQDLLVTVVTSKDEVAVVWRDVPPDGAPVVVSKTQPPAGIDVSLGDQKLEVISLTTYPDSGLGVAFLVLLDPSSPAFGDTATELLPRVFAAARRPHHTWLLAVADPDLRVVSEISGNTSAEGLMEALAEAASVRSTVPANPSAVSAALDLLSRRAEGRHALIAPVNMLLSPDGSEAAWEKGAASESTSSQLAVLPLAPGEPASADEANRLMDLAERHGGRVLPWLGRAPSPVEIGAALSELDSGGLARFIYPEQYRYSVPLEDHALEVVAAVARPPSAIVVSVDRPAPPLLDAPSLLAQGAWPVGWLTTPGRMISGVSVIAVYVAILALVVALVLLLLRRPQRFDLILEVFQPAALVRVRKLPFVIGRGAGADLSIEHETVSREHARIVRDRKGSLCIEDLQSTNGTFVDGERVNRASLRAHQGVRFGAVEARVKLD
jgi:hypothetical protein